MTNLRKIAIYVCVWLIGAYPALALNDTVGVTAGSGKTANLIAFGGGNVISEVGICDATTANQCAAVGAGGALLVTGTGGTFPVTGTLTAVTSITNALPAGTNVIGHVIADTGSTTAVTQATAGNLNATVVGTGTFAVQASAGTNLNTSLLALEAGGNLAAIKPGTDRLISSATNIVAGSALATTSFIIGTRYLSTPPTFTNGQEGAFQIDAAGRMLVTANATLGAETTKVIGTVRNLGNAGGIFDGATAAAVPANALQVGMAQGGNLIAMTGTSGNLNVQCANCSGSGVSTVDAATFAATTSLFAGSGGFFQTTATNNALTTGQQGMFQVTANRALFSNLRNAAGAEVGVAAVPLQVSLANTATNATAVKVDGSGVTQPVSLTSTTITGTVAATQSGTWNINNIAGTVTLPTGASTAALQPTNAAQGSTTSGQTGHLVECAVTTASPSYTTAQTDPLSCDTAGNLRVNIVAGSSSGAVAQGSTTSGQTGSLVQCATTTAAPTYTTAQTNPLSCDTAGSTRVLVTNATAALVGNVDGVTAATTTANSPTNSYLYTLNPAGTFDRLHSTKGQLNVVNGGSTYQHVAASQTAAVLQTSTGAAGDYLSHCVIYPSATNAGNITVFDNTNAAGTNVIEFATGTLSNLAPISIPVGAVSTAGAWKVTTGTGATVVCYGKFS